MCACFSAGVLVVAGRLVALLADRVGFRLAHTLAAHWQVVVAAEPARLWATRKDLKENVHARIATETASAATWVGRRAGGAERAAGWLVLVVRRFRRLRVFWAWLIALSTRTPH
jgi:hypothetical protein